MRQPSDLSREALLAIVEALQGHLYLERTGAVAEERIPPHAEYWNPDKPWDLNLLDSLAEILSEYDLVPAKITLAVPTSEVTNPPNPPERNG